MGGVILQGGRCSFFDPVPWRDKIKGAGFHWLHVVPSVKGALRCQKAGVDCIVASGHEGGFHIAWEPVHSMVLLPSVVDALSGSGRSGRSRWC